MMDYSPEDYDVDMDDHNTTAHYYDDSDEDYPSSEFNRYGNTFPGGLYLLNRGWPGELPAESFYF